MRSRSHGPGWTGPLDFGTLRDLERLAVQFTSDLRKLATQSSAAGENVISDLRTILEDALERIKSEIFGAGRGREPSADDTENGPSRTEALLDLGSAGPRGAPPGSPGLAYGLKTILPNRSPVIMASKPSRACASGRTRSITGRVPVCSQNLASRPS